MFPVERTPHAKRAAQVRRTMVEMYEDPEEKKKQAEDRLKYGEELRRQMVEQQAERQKQKDALKKADEFYFQRAQAAQAAVAQNNNNNQQQQQQQQQQASTSQATLRRPVPQLPSLLGQHQIYLQQQQQQQGSKPQVVGLDRLKEYPWQANLNPKTKVSGGNNNNGNILHEQSMDWLRIPRGYYGGMSQGPLEGLKRLRRELMLEYQQLGGDAASLLDQQVREKEQQARRDNQSNNINAFSHNRRPPQQQRGGFGMGYKPDQLDKWISDFQHKKFGRPGGGGGAFGSSNSSHGHNNTYGQGPQLKGGRFGRSQGPAPQHPPQAAYGMSPSLKAESELIYM
ncbi:hypothetical protein HOP50_08g53720 [Chloropicon primus]|uniref:Uncharacterized protein n=1 Tax=Chloropicon primus TaxID=1764295 RepID=A0A5B8MT63_9CHLO|nr:hypothetical protein A3770_08p53430 [Chloropicon primus]UPR02048.1 hypothetical protein HOP50_08g53720 [Chloropicon primus]|eukprot:QDZ22825.1 hypothetical protein A3770_08p53430 [Chloropicon primus]